MLPYEFHPLAARELDEAVEHYEAVAPGKGFELARQVHTAIAQVCEFPESAPVSRGAVRSVVVQPTSRWEYTVHYRVTLKHRLQSWARHPAALRGPPWLRDLAESGSCPEPVTLDTEAYNKTPMRH